jgi:hypothetical protein
MASFVIVSVLVILLTLITIGFAKIMDRAQQNSLNNQLSSAANYAAQAALKDISSAVIKAYQTSTPPAAPANTTCQPGAASIYSSIYTGGNLSGDNNTKYTCLLVNPNPDNLSYGDIQADQSWVVKANPLAGTISSMLIGWESPNGNTGLPAFGDNKLYSEYYWNTVKKFEPMLRVTLYPVNGITVTQGPTYFFYPNDKNGNVQSVNYGSNNAKVIPVWCTINDNNPAPGFGGKGNHVCNEIITGMPAASYYYARITPLYTDASVSIYANNSSNVAIQFSGTQAVVDVTAKAGSAVKRLQANVNLSSGTSSTSGDVSAINPADNDIPQYGLQSANAICKRLDVTATTGVVAGTTSAACKQQNTVTPPALPPSVTLVAHDQNTGAVGNSIAAAVGDIVDLTWKTVSVTSAPCTVSGDWSGTRPSAGGGPENQPAYATARLYTYNISCTGNNGSTVTATATVNVTATGSLCADGSAPPCPPPPPTGCTTNCPGNKQGVVVNISNAQMRTGAWSVDIINNGDGAGLQQCDLFDDGHWFESYYPNSNPASNPPVYSYSTSNDNWRGNILPVNSTLTIQCIAWDGGPPGSASRVIPPPPVVVKAQVVDAYVFTSPTGPTTCHDGLHDYILCISWNTYQDDGTYHPNQDPLGSEGGVVGNCTASGYGSSGGYVPNPGYTAGNPIVWNYWNRTIGWYSDPGSPINVTITCKSNTYGNFGSTDCTNGSTCPIVWTNGFCAPNNGAGGAPCNGTGAQANTCQDASATNYGGPLPCQYPTGGGGGGGGGGGTTCSQFGLTGTYPACNCPAAYSFFSGSACLCQYSGTYPNCGAPACDCFVAGTTVMMTNGLSKPIEKLKPGDYVMSYDPSKHTYEKSRISMTFVHQGRPTLHIRTTGGYNVTTTKVHPFWTDTGWVEAGDLVAGSSYVYDSHGQRQKVLSITAGKPSTVYNIEVDNNNHDFFANGLLVHNKLVCP